MRVSNGGHSSTAAPRVQLTSSSWVISFGNLVPWRYERTLAYSNLLFVYFLVRKKNSPACLAGHLGDFSSCAPSLYVGPAICPTWSCTPQSMRHVLPDGLLTLSNLPEEAGFKRTLYLAAGNIEGFSCGSGWTMARVSTTDLGR